jgi:hypothetical protein
MPPCAPAWYQRRKSNASMRGFGHSYPAVAAVAASSVIERTVLVILRVRYRGRCGLILQYLRLSHLGRSGARRASGCGGGQAGALVFQAQLRHVSGWPLDISIHRGLRPDRACSALDRTIDLEGLRGVSKERQVAETLSVRLHTLNASPATTFRCHIRRMCTS